MSPTRKNLNTHVYLRTRRKLFKSNRPLPSRLKSLVPYLLDEWYNNDASRWRKFGRLLEGYKEWTIMKVFNNGLYVFLQRLSFNAGFNLNGKFLTND